VALRDRHERPSPPPTERAPSSACPHGRGCKPSHVGDPAFEEVDDQLDARSAISIVARGLARVDFVGHVTDAADRRGVAVSYDGGGHRQEMIFDPLTAELLGERDVLLDQEEAGVSVGPDISPGTILGFAGPPGTVVFSVDYLETAVVDSIEERP
jgi:hypothetical protein